MSQQAILGSFQLWIEYQTTNEHPSLDKEEEIKLVLQENLEEESEEGETQE
jgi:hypothetical protein